MTNEDFEYEDKKPDFIVIFVTLVLGAGIAFALSTYMFNLSPAWLSILVGAACSLIGFFILGESIGDAIIFSIIFFIIAFVLITAAPQIEIIRMNIVPIATGICIGKLAHGIWKELI